ncbi:MAG: hypothetical protein P4L64_18785 [Caulobacteraceae bacterium]|nr:hypothetical protein [Caulobacteraceae bacterium]
MNAELEAFRTELRAAGEPYNLWGGRIVGIGLALLVLAQVLSSYSLLLLYLSLAVMAVGWVMLIIAFVRRRRWAKAHPLQEPSLTDLP